MASSDIIKIGFDYRSSLAQFEKETDGVFNEVEKQGQRIEIKLHADDKDIVKKIDALTKSDFKDITLSFNDKPIKEQSQLLEGLRKQILNIANMFKKGYKIDDIIDSTNAISEINNVTKANTDNIKQTSEIYKKETADFISNTNKKENAIDGLLNKLSQLNKKIKLNNSEKNLYDYNRYDGVELNKTSLNKALQKMPKNGNALKDYMQLTLRDRHGKNREDLLKVMGHFSDNLYEDIDQAAFKDINSKVSKNKALQINQSIQEYVKQWEKGNAEIQKIKEQISTTIDQLMNELDIGHGKGYGESIFQNVGGYLTTISGDSLSIDKILKDPINSLNSLIGSAISEQDKFQNELKETGSQVEKTSEKIKESTSSNSISSNDSQIEELKSDIKDVKTELGDVKDRISNIESNGFENVREDVEKTKESVKELNSELTEMKSNLSSTPTVNESNISSGRKDAFPNADTKLDEAVTSAKDLDKTLEQVDMPTDSFDKVLEKLDRTKSELVDIVKITKQSVSDAEGKFHDSYTLKDSRGSTEIYGMNSKTDKGQILRQNIVGYDSKKDSVDESKELLAVERQVTSEINAQTKAQQKKWQAFSKEQSDYEKSVNETNSAIQKTDELLDKLPLHDKLDAQFIDVLDSVDKLNSKLKLGEISLSEYKNEVKTITSEYSKLVNIQNKADESASKQQAKDIQTEWDKNIKAIQNYMDAVTKLNNLKAKDKGTGSEANQIALQTQNVEELKQTALEARKNLSSMQAENPDIIIWKQWVDMMELFDQASKGSAESAAKLKDVLDNIKVPSLDKYENKLSSYQAKTGGYDATIARFKDGGWTSPEYLKNVQAVEAAVKKYEDLLSNIKAKGGIASEKDVQTLKEYEGEIKKTISTVTNMSAAEKGYNFVSGQKELDKIHKLLNENSKMSSDAKAKIRAYYREIESGNPSMSLDRIHGEIMKIYNAEVEAGRAGRTFLDTLKNSGFHQFAAQMAGMFSFYDIINVARQGINTIRELDEAMTEVRKVSEATESQYSSFQQTVASTAKEIASTNKELLNSSADFLRLGYDLNQAEDLAKNATLFVNVGDGVDITAATEDMITAMKAFDIQAEDSIKIVDDYNQIGNMYALSATDIGEAMKRSASALETGNNSFEQSIGLITAMNEIVQNSENTGNTLKVLSLRLRGAKAELESMSEDTDGLCDSTSKLREQIQALTGVDIMLDDNTFKSTADIIKELGAVWNNLTDSSQAATLEIIAGKTRANNVAALLKNYQQIDNVISDLGDAQGSAARENAAIIDSINGRIKILSASAEEFWQTVINKDAVKNAVTFASDLLGVLSKVIDKIGVLPTLLTGVGAGLSLKNIGKCYVSA